jgi:putative membrane protein
VKARWASGAAAALCAGPAWAHGGDGAGVLAAVDPVTAGLLAATALLYAAGDARAGARARAPRRLFWWGWAVLAVALLPPLDALGEELFAAHMVQHELLLLVAAPLLVLSRPAGTLLWALPAAWRPAVAAAVQRGPGPVLRVLAQPGPAWALHAIVLWGWHVPALFDAALRNEALHVLQHASFLASALLFWWSLAGATGRARRLGTGVIYVFTTAVHSSVLGALLTFASTAWYAPYLDTTARWGLSPGQDQQLGGLIMWVPGGGVLLLAGLWLVHQWLQESEWRDAQVQRRPSRD